MAVSGVGNLDNSLLTALSGLQTTQQLLNTTSRNITNAQTVGYVNKTQQAVSNATSGGSLAGPIVRFINASLQQKLRTNNADTAYQQAVQTALTQMNQLSGDPAQGTSIEAQLNTLQGDFQELSANPQDPATAENVLGAAGTLTQSFNQQTDALFALQRTAQGNVVNDVTQINADLQQIATLNQQTVSAQANKQDPTDLEDQRDDAVNNLSQLIGVNAFIDNSGVLQVLTADFKPLAGLYAEHLTYNQTTNVVSVSGQQLNNISGDLGGNLQVLTTTTTGALQNLSEVANQVTSAFQGLPTSILGLNGTLAAAPVGGFVASPDVQVPAAGAPTPTTLITSNGNQYSATLAYRPVVGTSTYQLVISSMTPVQGAPQVTVPAYNGAANTGGIVIGTVDVSTVPPTFAGQQVQLTPAVANTQPGTIGALTAFTNGLSTGANAPTAITANNKMTLFVQSDGVVPQTSLTMTGTLPPAGVEQFQDTAASNAFTLTTDLGNQYTATVAYRPQTPGANGSGYQVVVTSLTPLNGAPAVGNLNYTAGAVGVAGTGGIVIGTFNGASSPPAFNAVGTITGIPASINTPSQFPGHIEPIVANSAVTQAAGAPTIGVGFAAANNVTAPYYSGNIEVNPNISLRALQVGDQFANTAADTNVGAAMSAASQIINNQFAFTTSGITGTQTLEAGAGQSTINVGQNLANANNQITTLSTANTQINQAIAPQSEVNLDTQMSQLVVLQNLYQANARVVTVTNALLDTLVSLPT